MTKEFIVDDDIGIGELSPGSTPRRWEPEEGITSLKHRIHRESKKVDEHSNLEFTFSKPKKIGKRKIAECSNCGKAVFVSINTVGIICNSCHSYASVREIRHEC